MGEVGLTLAGVSVALLRRTPGQVVEHVGTALTVDPRSLMLAVTLRTHLLRHTQLIKHSEHPDDLLIDIYLY